MKNFRGLIARGAAAASAVAGLRFTPLMSAFVVAITIAAIPSAASAAVVFTTNLVGTTGGFDEWAVTISAFTGGDAIAGNGIMNTTGDLTSPSGLFALNTATTSPVSGTKIITSATKNFSNNGAGLDGGGCFVNLDTFRAFPTFNFVSEVGGTNAVSTASAIDGWTAQITSTDEFLKPGPGVNGSGNPLNLLADIYVTTGAPFTLSGTYSTTVASAVPFTITNAVPEPSSLALLLAISTIGLTRRRRGQISQRIPSPFS